MNNSKKNNIAQNIEQKKRGRKPKPKMAMDENGNMVLAGQFEDIVVNKNVQPTNKIKSYDYYKTLPLAEKYRPKDINNIILDDTFKTKILNIVQYDMLQNIIISGNSGTGKTTTLLCIAKQILGNDAKDCLLELNASDSRGLTMITTITHFCEKLIITDRHTKKIIIFDEADNMTDKAQLALYPLIDEYANNTKFCFTCNDSTKIIHQIQSRCITMNFRPVNPDKIMEKIKEICIKENIQYDEKALRVIVEFSHGDVRYSLNYIEALHNSYGVITVENVYKFCHQPNPVKIIEIVQKAYVKNFTACCECFNELKNQGYCNSDILQTLITVLKTIQMPSEYVRLGFIRIISDTYILVSDNMDTNLQMYSCFSKMVNLNHSI